MEWARSTLPLPLNAALKMDCIQGVAICRLWKVSSSRWIGEDNQDTIESTVSLLWVVCFLLFCSGIPNLASSLEHQNGQLQLQKPSGSGLKSKMLNRSAETSPSPSLFLPLPLSAAATAKKILPKTPKQESFLFDWRSCTSSLFFLFCFVSCVLWPSEPDHEPSYRKYPVSWLNYAPDFWLEDQ